MCCDTSERKFKALLIEAVTIYEERKEQADQINKKRSKV
jgi:hypothetical protein